MKSHKEEHPAGTKEKKENSLKALMATHPTLPELYQQHCKQLKLKPDPSVMRMLEKGINDIFALDLSTLVFSPYAFEAVMEVCRILPHLGSIDLSNSNLKPECIQTLCDMAEEHPTLHSLDLSNNNTLGFSAAKLLLPLIKDNKRFIKLDVEGTGMAAPTKQLIKKVLIANRRYRENMGDSLDDLENPVVRPTGRDSVEVTDVESTTSPTPSPMKGARIHPVGGAKDTPDQNLSSEEVAVRQVNDEVRSVLVSHEGRLLQHYGDLLQTSERQQVEVREQMHKGHSVMDVYKEQWRWPTVSDFSMATLAEEMDLDLPEVELENFSKMYTPANHLNLIQIKPIFNELLEPGCSRRRKAALIKDIGEKVKGHGPGMATLVELANAFCDLMNQDGNTMEAMKHMLEETEDQIQSLKSKIDRAETSRQRAVQEEDLRSAETHFESSLDLQEELIDVILYRLNNLLDKASKARLLENLAKLESQGAEQIQESRHINDELMEKIRDDRKKANQREEDEEAAWKQRQEDFAAMGKKTNDSLDANLKEQDSVWNNIINNFNELNTLANDRMQQIELWMIKVEDHDRAKVEYHKTVAICQEHVANLNRLNNDAENCDNLIKQFSDFVDSAVAMTKQVADATSTEGDMLALDEQKRYLGLFRRFYLQLGELLFKKQKRLEEVDRMIRSCEFQIDFCKETLDPDLRRYRDQLKDLQLRRVEVADRVSRLQIRGDDRSAQYLPHEDALKKAGLEFDSPIMEMHEQVVDARGRVLQQRQKFIKKDKEELVDKEATEIDELVHSTQMARSAGLSTLISPLSNSSTPTPGGRTPTRTPVPVE